MPSCITVYSYSRWSTPEQSKGDSGRRQHEAAERWAAKHDYVLNQNRCILDSGCSAYRGDNATDGGLARFLEACREGVIEPGSILLVESLDRISRMAPRRAQRLIDEIVDSGVTIVTLCDDQHYTADRLDNDPLALLLALMVSWRAHEESKTKASRVASAWKEKRRRVRLNPTEVFTYRGPAWLQPNIRGGWEENRNKSDVVRRIFAMTLAGFGEHRIAAELNQQAIPTLSRGLYWHRSTVCKLLRNAAVIGRLSPGRMEYVNRRRVRVLEDPVEGAFPPIVSLDDWLAVRALKDGRSGGPRGRHASNGVAHYLAGLARCPNCDATMVRVNKGSSRKGGVPKLVCSRAKSKAGCRYVGVSITQIERAFLSKWPALLESLGRGAVKSPETGILTSNRAAVETLRGLLADGQKRLNRCHVNAALKVLFVGVQVNHEASMLRFQCRAGGAWAMPY